MKNASRALFFKRYATGTVPLTVLMELVIKALNMY
jgi:hypothetical protein